AHRDNAFRAGNFAIRGDRQSIKTGLPWHRTFHCIWPLRIPWGALGADTRTAGQLRLDVDWTPPPLRAGHARGAGELCRVRSHYRASDGVLQDDPMNSVQVNDGPLVSVIVPAYNRARIIRETIENIFEQTYANIELIIVDDGSSDDTQTILRSYGSRIQWIAQKNAGPAAARNRGINMAKGDIIAFQDSDYAWHPTKIERQVSLLQRAGESAVCCLCNSFVQLYFGKVERSFERAGVHPPIEEGIWLNPAEVLATSFLLFNQAVAIRRKVLERI